MISVEATSFALPTSPEEVKALFAAVHVVEESLQAQAQVHSIRGTNSNYEGWAIPATTRRTAKTPGIFVAVYGSPLQLTLLVHFLNLKTGCTNWFPPGRPRTRRGAYWILRFDDGAVLYNTKLKRYHSVMVPSADDGNINSYWKNYIVPAARRSALKLTASKGTSKASSR
jgi:hypothetical protein